MECRAGAHFENCPAKTTKRKIDSRAKSNHTSKIQAAPHGHAATHQQAQQRQSFSSSSRESIKNIPRRQKQPCHCVALPLALNSSRMISKNTSSSIMIRLSPTLPRVDFSSIFGGCCCS
eukprot:scaffold3240_cov187-Amphora_coffeaeformis.AAC.14